MNFRYVRQDAPAQQSNDVSSAGPVAVRRPCCSTQEQGWRSLAGTAGLVNMQDNQDKHSEVTLDSAHCCLCLCAWVCKQWQHFSLHIIIIIISSSSSSIIFVVVINVVVVRFCSVLTVY